MKWPCPPLSCDSWLSPEIMVSPLAEVVVAGNPGGADRTGLVPFGWRVGHCGQNFGCFTGTRSRGLVVRRKLEAWYRYSSASTGKRADPGENRCDRCSRRGSSRYRWCPYRCVVSMNGIHQRVWCFWSCILFSGVPSPTRGCDTFEAVLCFQAYLSRGCGSQRAPVPP